MKYLCYALYILIGKRIPSLRNSYSSFSSRIRMLLVRGYIIKCGRNVNIQPHATIARRIEIGDYSGIGRNCLVQGGVKIGKYVMMGPEVYIYTQNHDFQKTDIPMSQQGFAEEKPVVIEDDVWIGSRVTILPGVRICSGSIIGASAVVTKDVPPYCVVAGNPAKIVKTRK